MLQKLKMAGDELFNTRHLQLVVTLNQPVKEYQPVPGNNLSQDE